MTFAPLKGSEKQIAWAEKIRRDILNSVPQEKRHLIYSCTSAKILIDNRYYPNTLVEELEKLKNQSPEKKTEKKTEWRKFALNIQNIETTTQKGVLIKLPNKSLFKGFKFWASKSLLRDGRHSYENILLVRDEEIELIKSSSKNVVTTRKKVSADKVAEAFGGWIVGFTNTSKRNFNEEEVIIEKHVPETLEAVEIEPDEDLLR